MTDTDAVAAESQKLEDERYQAMITADVATLDRLLSERLAYAHSNGARDTKESYPQKIRAGVIDHRPIEHPVERITVFGDAALAVGAAEGGWALVAYQPTPLPE